MNPNPKNGERHKESDGKLLEEKKTECNETSWPHLEEEDYIVFCFTEDGDIRVVEDRKKESDIEIYPPNQQEMVISFEKGEEKLRDNEIIRETISTSSSSESSEYSQSNASKRSFAFPVLGWEWAGSPVHIPKQEDSQEDDIPYSKKHRGRYRWLFLHCCRS